jgi:hypothetical protein
MSTTGVAASRNDPRKVYIAAGDDNEIELVPQQSSGDAKCDRLDYGKEQSAGKGSADEVVNFVNLRE